MRFYADPSFLFPIYVLEKESQRAMLWMERYQASLPFTPFHRHELRTALRQKVYQGRLSATDKTKAFRDIDDDLAEGRLTHMAVPWTDAFREAEAIASQWGETKPIRSADLLHLGIARALKAEKFITFDARQAEVALACGMKLALSASTAS